MSKLLELLKEKLDKEAFDKIKDVLGDKKADFLDGYIPLSRFNEINDKYKTSTEKVTDLEQKITDMANLTKDNEDLKGKMSDIENKYKDILDNKDKEIQNISKKSLVKELLLKSGGFEVDLLLHDIKLDDVTIKDDNIVNSDNIINELKNKRPSMFTKIEKTQDNNNRQGDDKQGDDGDDFYKNLEKQIFD